MHVPILLCCITFLQSPVQSWQVEGEVEKVLWNHFHPKQLLVSAEERAWRVWRGEAGKGKEAVKGGREAW